MAKFYTAVVTVFREDGSLDREGNIRVYENLMKAGSDGIVLLGSTGEFCSIDMKTAKELTELALDTIKGRIKVIVGASRMIPEESVELANFALKNGADATILISPFYFKLSDAGVENYYDLTVPHIKGDVYLYNFPGCTAHDLCPEIALRLRRKYPNIRGYKDTVKDFSHTRRLCEIMHREYPDFAVYSGYDEFFVQNALAGGSGCIGGLPNLYPELFADWSRAVNSGDWEKIRAIQKKVDRMMELFEICSPFLTAVKRAMKLRGLIENEYGRAPLTVADEKETVRIERLLSDLKLL